MKKIWNFIVMFLRGIIPAMAGHMVVVDVYFVVRNIIAITTSSGWNVVYYFCMAVLEIILALALLCELGRHDANSNNWTKYKKAQAADNIDSSSEDSETSDEATDTSSNAQPRGKRKKSQ